MLMLLGLGRLLVLSASDAVAAYLTTPNHADFWHKARQRVLWLTFPSLVLRRARPGMSNGTFAYPLCLCGLSLVVRAGAVLVPAFMAAHVYLWKRGLGLPYWPALPKQVADVLAIVTIVGGFALLLGRIYSPLLRRMEPAWSFVKPLILIIPFLTGFLSMRPAWSPIDYHVVMLLHVLSASLVFVMIPFARLLACNHTPLTVAVPEARWDALPAPGGVAARAKPEAQSV